MKRLGDWEFVLGVNTLNQHLAHMTIAGARKYDYPQSFSYHTPWWPYYKSLNDHFTRLTYAITRGEEQNGVLVIEPTTSAWMYYNHDRSNERISAIGNEFQAFVTRLQKAQVEYDLGSEYIIREYGSVSNGKFVVGKRSYTKVVLPPGMDNIDAYTLQLLRTFVKAGGKVVQTQRLTAVDGRQQDGLENFGSGDDKALLSDDISFNVSGGDLFHQRRQLKDGQLLFLVNSDMEATAKVEIGIKGKRVLLLNTFTGAMSSYPAEMKEGRVSFTCTIPPAGDMLLLVTNGDAGSYPAFVAAEEGKVLSTGGQTKVIRPTENTLMIDFCDVHIGNAVLKDMHTYYAADTVFKHFGFGDGNPWNTSVQYKRNIVDRDTFSRGQGFSITYHFTVDGRPDVKGFRAVVERAGSYKIMVNGQAVKPEAGKWWLDKSFGVLNIGAYVRAGENDITVSTDKMSIYDEVEPIYILGNFDLVSAAKGWTVSAPTGLSIGSWKTQGMPMYGGGVRYVKEVQLGTIPSKLVVRLGKWNGTMAAVKVNGKPAGVIAYDPFELDISKYAVAGKNKIEITVIGSLKNLLGPHHHTPKPGLASPWHWRNIRTYPAGKDYDVYDYGLMEDFQLVKY